MTSVCIRDYGSQKVCIGYAASLCLWHGYPLFPLLTVMEQLGEKKLVNLVRNGVLVLSACHAIFPSPDLHMDNLLNRATVRL